MARTGGAACLRVRLERREELEPRDAERRERLLGPGNLANTSALNQTATNQSLAQNAANAARNASFMSQGSNLSFSNLTNQNLQHVRVLVSSVASQAQQAMNVFTGANQSVFATGAFPLGVAGCN